MATPPSQVLASQVLDVPRPEWMSDDLTMLEDMANRFMESEIAPHYERYDRPYWCRRFRHRFAQCHCRALYPQPWL